jgi:hypothetical protein
VYFAALRLLGEQAELEVAFGHLAREARILHLAPALQALDSRRLITYWEESHRLTIELPPEPVTEAVPGWDENSMQRWLRQTGYFPDEERWRPKDADDIDQLLEFAHAIGIIRRPGTAHKERTAARALLREHTFKELKPWLVAFLSYCHPDVERFGLTLITFMKHLHGLKDGEYFVARYARAERWVGELHKLNLARYIEPDEQEAYEEQVAKREAYVKAAKEYAEAHRQAAIARAKERGGKRTPAEEKRYQRRQKALRNFVPPSLRQWEGFR